MTGYIDPSQAAGRALMRRGLVGPVVMLNLLRFRSIADYGDAPALTPPSPRRIGGFTTLADDWSS
jgi:hypothetical protein